MAVYKDKKTNELKFKKRVIYDQETFNQFIKYAANELEKTLFYTMFYTGA